MNLRKPPRLADWLMRRYQVADSVSGDLHEEFRNGRSRSWFWRQTMAAVAATRTGIASLVVIGWLTQLPIALALWAFHIPSHPLQLTATTIGVAVIVLANVFGFGLAFASELNRLTVRPQWKAFFMCLGVSLAVAALVDRPTLAELALFQALALVDQLIRAWLRPKGRSGGEIETRI